MLNIEKKSNTKQIVERFSEQEPANFPKFPETHFFKMDFYVLLA